MVYQLLLASVVGAQGEGISVDSYFLLKMPEDRNIRPSEAVDRLLLVTHEEELVAVKVLKGRNPALLSRDVRSFGQQEQKVPLDSVVVLELIYHDEPETVLVDTSELQVVPECKNGKLRNIPESHDSQTPFLGIHQIGELLHGPLENRCICTAVRYVLKDREPGILAQDGFDLTNKFLDLLVLHPSEVEIVG